ncbi:hypothetical protein SAMN04487941_1019 [Pontibacter akesuensis]|uniref:Uncharacterized protein n=1 Tax=Pontibacter akesuensis TaxID=388950 RepID=A0A1I7GHL2_9BACT|nr:hypothetical protein SAMN04487941_1019 [Pontibacter akesuensis]
MNTLSLGQDLHGTGLNEWPTPYHKFNLHIKQRLYVSDHMAPVEIC